VRDVLEAIVSAGTIDAWCVISRFSKGKKVTDRVANVLNCSDENLDLARMAMGKVLEEVFSCMIVLLSLGGVKDDIISVAPNARATNTKSLTSSVSANFQTLQQHRASLSSKIHP
jgi:hypothetical protein